MNEDRQGRTSAKPQIFRTEAGITAFHSEGGHEVPRAGDEQLKRVPLVREATRLQQDAACVDLSRPEPHESRHVAT